MGNVVTMPKRKPEKPDPSTPWGALGFPTERDMLLDDLQDLSRRIKDPKTTATAVAALSKRKHEILEMLRALDEADDPDSILDDTEDEAWDGQS